MKGIGWGIPNMLGSKKSETQGLFSRADYSSTLGGLGSLSPWDQFVEKQVLVKGIGWGIPNVLGSKKKNWNMGPFFQGRIFEHTWRTWTCEPL